MPRQSPSRKMLQRHLLKLPSRKRHRPQPRQSPPPLKLRCLRRRLTLLGLPRPSLLRKSLCRVRQRPPTRRAQRLNRPPLRHRRVGIPQPGGADICALPAWPRILGRRGSASSGTSTDPWFSAQQPGCCCAHRGVGSFNSSRLVALMLMVTRSRTVRHGTCPPAFPWSSVLSSALICLAITLGLSLALYGIVRSIGWVIGGFATS